MTRFLKIGLFVIITGTTFSYYLLQTSDSLTAPDTYTVKTVMEDAGGLLNNSAVEMAGVKVGRVSSIELQDGKALITMEISTDVPLYPDAQVEKRMESMLGSSVIQISSGTKQKERIKTGGYIRKTTSKTSMDKALGGAGEVTEEAIALLKDLRRLLNEQNGLDNLEVILEELRRTTETSGNLIEENLQLLSGTLRNLQRISQRYSTPSQPGYQDLETIRSSTARITQTLDQLLQESGAGQGDSLLGVKQSLKNLRESTERINAITRDLEEGKGTAGKLLKEEELYNQILEVSQDVNTLVGSISRLETQIGFQADYRILHSNVQSQLNLRLQPEDQNRFYSIGLSQVPRGHRVTTTTETTKTGSIKEDYVTEETVTSNAYLLNLLLGHQFGPVSLYGGLMENTGGLGMAYRPFEQLALSADIYEFGTPLPNLRTEGLIYPFFNPESENLFHWIYFSGGAEDVLNGAQRDYYLGLGVRYRDQNIKTLLPFVPAP